jgi:hypothetical protein
LKKKHLRMKLLIVCALICSVTAVSANGVIDKEGLRDLVLNSVKDAMDPHMKSDMSVYTHEDHHQVAKDLHKHLHQMSKSLSPVLTEEERRGCRKIKRVPVKRISAKRIVTSTASVVCGAPQKNKKCATYLKARKTLKKASTSSKGSKGRKGRKGRKGKRGFTEVSSESASFNAATDVLDLHSSRVGKSKRIRDKYTTECTRYVQQKKDQKKNAVVYLETDVEMTEEAKAAARVANNMNRFWRCACTKDGSYDPRKRCGRYAAKGTTGFANSMNRIAADMAYRMKKGKCARGRRGLAETKSAGKYPTGVFFDKKTKNFILSIMFPSVSCEVQWSPWNFAVAGGRCIFWKVLHVSITIDIKKKYIKITVKACPPGVAVLEKMLRKIPGVGRMLDKEGIKNGCIYLGHGVYDWGYQNLELATREFCAMLAIFKACAKFEFHARIKTGGLYKGVWGQRDIASRKCNGCTSAMVQKGSWVYEDFKFGKSGPNMGVKGAVKAAGKLAAQEAKKKAIAYAKKKARELAVQQANNARAAVLRSLRNRRPYRAPYRRRPARRRPARRRRRRWGLIQTETETAGCRCRPWIHFRINANVKFLGIGALCSLWKRKLGLVQSRQRGWARRAFRSVRRFARRAVRVVKRAARAVARVAVKVWNAIKPTWCSIFDKDVVDKYY